MKLSDLIEDAISLYWALGCGMRVTTSEEEAHKEKEKGFRRYLECIRKIEERGLLLDLANVAEKEKPLNMSRGDEVMLSTEEVSRYLGGEEKPIPIPTLARWRSEGKGPRYVRFGSGSGSTIRYRQNDLEEYIERHTVQAEQNEPRPGTADDSR